MGSPSKVVHGARVIVSEATYGIVGIFDNCEYSYPLTVDSAYILGSFAAADLGHTAAEVVRFDCSGWRVVGKGPFDNSMGKSLVPTLNQLLNYQDLKFTVKDRQTGKVILTAYRVRSAGVHGGFSARQLSKMSLPFVGITMGDESDPNSIETGANTLT